MLGIFRFPLRFTPCACPGFCRIAQAAAKPEDLFPASRGAVSYDAALPRGWRDYVMGIYARFLPASAPPGQRWLPALAAGKEGAMMMAEKRRQICRMCGKPSEKMICDACSDRLRGEALERKKKEEKIPA
jgi:hypothetical protein